MINNLVSSEFSSAQQQNSKFTPASPPGPTHSPSGDEEGSKSVCDDWTNGDRLCNNEIQTVLSRVGPIDIIGFDACLMGMVETAYEMRDLGEFMVASEELVPGIGWPYDSILFHLDSNPSMNPELLASVIVNEYHEYYGVSGDRTLSATDLSKMSPIKDAINTFCQAMMSDTTFWSEIRNAALIAEHYANFDHRDLYDFAYWVKNLVTNANIDNTAQDVMQAINNAVIAEYHGTGHPYSHGLAIYLPSAYNAGTFKRYTELNNIDFPIDSDWDEFLCYLWFGSPGCDPYEPNNSYAQAFGPLNSGEVYESFLPSLSDEDWYMICFGENTDLSIDLSVPSDADFDLYLYNSNGTTILQTSLNRGNGVSETINYGSAPPGTYYVLVTPYSSYSNNPYELTAIFSGGGSGSVPLSYDDGSPSGDIIMTSSGDALALNFTLPSMPMKLEKIYYYLNSLEGVGSKGNGSFSIFVMDQHDYIVSPFPVTPSDTGWNEIDLSSEGVTLHTDFFVGALYDGVNTPSIGIDSINMGRSFYWLESNQQWYQADYSLFIRAEVSYSTTDVQEQEIASLPKKHYLSQNYPNPFNPSTIIKYQLNGESLSTKSPILTTLKIYNIRGQLVRTLVNEEELPGNYSVLWDGKDQCGNQVASGIYFYHLQGGDFSEAKKMVLLR